MQRRKLRQKVETESRDRKQRNSEFNKDTKLHKINRFSEMYFSNIYLRARGKKNYCDGHMDRVVYTNKCDFLVTNICIF